MANAGVAEELPGADELYRLDASESGPEDGEDDSEDDDENEDRDGEGIEPDDIPHG